MWGTAVATDLAGNTALVTGASRGIGRAIALGLADAGASLILVARSASQLAQTQAMALARGALPGQVHVIAADLGDAAQARAAARNALETVQVDILINNAATAEPLGATASIPGARLHRALEVNVITPAMLSAAVLPGMLEAGWGRIVNISRGIAARPGRMAGGSAYAAAKAALQAHTASLAAELAGSGVTVNAYRPGTAGTAMQAWIRDQDPGRIGTALHERLARSYAEGTLGLPEQSAAVLINHLSGDETGAIWDLDPASRSDRARRMISLSAVTGAFTRAEPDSIGA